MARVCPKLDANAALSGEFPHRRRHQSVGPRTIGVAQKKARRKQARDTRPPAGRGARPMLSQPRVTRTLIERPILHAAMTGAPRAAPSTANRAKSSAWGGVGAKRMGQRMARRARPPPHQASESIWKTPRSPPRPPDRPANSSGRNIIKRKRQPAVRSHPPGKKVEPAPRGLQRLEIRVVEMSPSQTTGPRLWPPKAPRHWASGAAWVGRHHPGVRSRRVGIGGHATGTGAQSAPR
jgi:hypothetical protein